MGLTVDGNEDGNDSDDWENMYMKTLDGNGRGSDHGNEGRDSSENRSEDEDRNGGKDINGDTYNDEEFGGNDNEGREDSQKKLAGNKRKVTEDATTTTSKRKKMNGSKGNQAATQSIRNAVPRKNSKK